MPEQAQYRQRGFSLLELLLAMVIIGVVAAATVTLVNSVRHSAKAGETKQRMEIVAAKMQEYYRHQGNLPTPDGATLAADATLTGRVPVTALNLETRHAYDAWGQPFDYIIRTRATSTDTDIAAITVDHIDNMAGVLISGGGNQTQESATWDSSNLVAASTGDDLVLAINVNREAMEVALNEVRELQRRVQQFDNLFTGSGACVPAETPADSGCNPGTNPELGGVNCGTASLDQIESVGAGSADNYGCENTTFGREGDFTAAFGTNDENAVLKFIVGYYALGNNFLLDPWGNPYIWGCAKSDAAGTPLCGDEGFHTFDPRYRKFFSMGPDGIDSVTEVSSGNTVDGPRGTSPATYNAFTSFGQFSIIDDVIP